MDPEENPEKKKTQPLILGKFILLLQSISIGLSL